MGGHKIVIKNCDNCGKVIVKDNKEDTLFFRNRSICKNDCAGKKKSSTKVKK